MSLNNIFREIQTTCLGNQAQVHLCKIFLWAKYSLLSYLYITCLVHNGRGAIYQWGFVLILTSAQRTQSKSMAWVMQVTAFSKEFWQESRWNRVKKKKKKVLCISLFQKSLLVLLVWIKIFLQEGICWLICELHIQWINTEAIWGLYARFFKRLSS